MAVSSYGTEPDPPPAPPPRLLAAVVVGVGGAIGALARAGVAEALPHPPGTWAWSTFVANATGCLALAGLTVLLAARFPADRYRRLLLGTGVLGGYTTFSTFSVDAVELLRTEREGMAAAYVLVSVLVLLVATVVGLWLARAAVARRAA
jgi:CrcB protein